MWHRRSGRVRPRRLFEGLTEIVGSQALARQLQAEEDEHAREAYQRRQQALERRRLEEASTEDERGQRHKWGKGKKNKNCVVM